VPIPATQTGYPPEDTPQTVELSEATRATIEHRRANEAPTGPPRETDSDHVRPNARNTRP
jgi:hypothetical protein